MIQELCIATGCQYHLIYPDKLQELLDFIESKVKEGREEMKKECSSAMPPYIRGHDNKDFQGWYNTWVGDSYAAINSLK